MKKKHSILPFILFFFLFQHVIGQSVKMPEEIILGTVYNYFHEEYPTDEDFFKAVDRDIPEIKNANLNAIMAWPVTQWDTKTKQLRWNRGDYLIDKIEDEGLNLSLLLFKQQQCSHYFPIWKFDEFSELKEEHKQAQGGSWDVDFRIPEVKTILHDNMKDVVRRYGNKPNVILYNIWNEPHYYSNQTRKNISPRYTKKAAVRKINDVSTVVALNLLMIIFIILV